MAKLKLIFKGGDGSGNFGHAGRAGEVGGSSTSGSGGGKMGALRSMPEYYIKESVITARLKKAGGGEASPALSYVVIGAMHNTHGSTNAKKATQSFIDSVENENYYGDKKDIVRERNIAKNVYADIMREYGMKFDAKLWDTYERSQQRSEGQ